MNYDDFIASKKKIEVPTGHNPGDLNEHLFDFQHAIVTWAVRRGRAAIFADTGLGKTLMQLSWAQEVQRHTGGKVLILAPLAVSEQTIEQGSTFGIDVRSFREWSFAEDAPGVYITNYERIDEAFATEWAGIVLDESSILKSHDGKTGTKIIDYAQGIPYRLSCTATPSPNDFEELGNQCEFLGVMTRTEMLATYFVNDTGDTGTWRLKGWGASKFWEWMGTWAVVLRNPSDIGFDGSAYLLPAPEYFEHVVDAESDGDLFAKPAQTMTERRKAQRNSIEQRCAALAALVNSQPDEPWLIWCHLNDEAELLASLIPGAVNVQGSDSSEFKVAASRWFCNDDSLQNNELCDKLKATKGVARMDEKKEKRRAYMREYYAANKEKFRPKSPEKRDEYNANRREKYSADPVMQEKYRLSAREWRAANPERRQDQRMRKYGITDAEYQRMFDGQSGKCAICRSDSTGHRGQSRLHVDHCHSTGVVRGLLCLSCNHGIGKFRDSIERLERAIEYLRKSN